ncbi:MAG TPA: hypothetical protein VHJ19_05055 [Gammaproteobacteria bacterium]|nr:hypothetical protein [Gammaproteobacteria bacterium]
MNRLIRPAVWRQVAGQQLRQGHDRRQGPQLLTAPADAAETDELFRSDTQSARARPTRDIDAHTSSKIAGGQRINGLEWARDLRSSVGSHMHACTLTRQRCDRSHGDCGHGLLRRSALIELARCLTGIQCRLIERGG